MTIQQPGISAEALEERNQNLDKLGDYLLDGEPLEQDTFVALMRDPEVVADELVGKGRLATLITARTVEQGGNAPELEERYEKVQAMLAKAREMGLGRDDYAGTTMGRADDPRAINARSRPHTAHRRRHPHRTSGLPASY